MIKNVQWEINQLIDLKIDNSINNWHFIYLNIV